jgi:hypothetical protein
MLQDCALSVYKPNPRQYVARIPQVRNSQNSQHCQAPQYSIRVQQMATTALARWLSTAVVCSTVQRLILHRHEGAPAQPRHLQQAKQGSWPATDSSAAAIMENGKFSTYLFIAFLKFVLNPDLQIPDMEVWYQRASDVVRKLRLGDIDLGIVGYDMFSEIGEGDE